MTVSLQPDTFQTGILPGAGSFACLNCEAALVLNSLDELPECPHCGGQEFRRASLFEHASPHEAPTSEATSDPALSPTEWLDEIRAQLEGSGQFVAYQAGSGVTLLSIAEGWTRIGRSTGADIRLDDPTVSRRHALLVSQAGKVRVLDDRSLNGIFVNGEQVDWKPLADGDDVAVGRYHLHFLEA